MGKSKPSYIDARYKENPSFPPSSKTAIIEGKRIEGWKNTPAEKYHWSNLIFSLLKTGFGDSSEYRMWNARRSRECPISSPGVSHRGFLEVGILPLDASLFINSWFWVI